MPIIAGTVYKDPYGFLAYIECNNFTKFTGVKNVVLEVV
jgi:hypothetical protein